MIAGAHGIRGQVRLRSFTDDPEAIFKYKPLTSEDGTREFKLKLNGVAKNEYIVTVAGITDRNQSEALCGTKLFMDRAKLPKAKKGEFYETDLIGLTAKDVQGKTYGTIMAFHDYGAGPFLEIGTSKKDSFMLPFNDTYVPDVNMKEGFAKIDPPNGWLEKDEEEQEE
jgi:16S rRNA processing protein RimM